jgi:TP901 family phage tail tape measure protein
VAVPIVVEFVAGTAGLSSGIGKVYKELGALKLSAEASMANVGKLGVAVSGLMVVAAGSVAVASIKMAGDYQSAIVHLTTDAGEAKSNMQMVSDGILQIAQSTGSSTKDLVNAMYYIESSGQHGAQALDTLHAAAEGAKVGNADLTTVSQALTTVMTAYGPSAGTATQATDGMIYAVSQGKTKLEDFAGAMATLLPAGAAVHIPLAELEGALATMTAQGQDAASGATHLRQTILQLANPTAKARTEMEALGLNAFDVSSNLGKNGLTGTFDILTQAIASHTEGGAVLIDQLKSASKNTTAYQQVLANLSPTQQTTVAALADMTGGTKSLQAVLQLTGDQAERFRTTSEGVANAMKSAGSDVNDWDVIQGTFNQHMSELRSTIEVLAIKIGTALLPAVTKIADAFGVFLNFVADHTWALAALAAVIGGALIVALSALAVALWGIASNPVVLIVAAIIAAVALLGVGIYELATHWSTVWGGIKTVTATVATFFVDRWNLAWSQVQGVLSAISGFFSTVWNAVSSVTMTVIGAITGFISDAWNSVWSTTQAVWGAISGFFSTWWPLLLAVFAAPIFALLVMWHAFHDEVWALVQGVWSRISGYLSGVWSVITAAASAAWSAFESDVVGPVQSAAATISGVWSGVVSFLSGVWSSITSGVSSAWDTVVSVVSSAVAAVLSAVTSVGGSILHAIEQPFIDAYNFISGLVGQFFSVGENIVQGIISGVESAAGGLLSSLSSLAGDALSAAKSAIGIKSPSTAFADQVGGPISQGIAVGVTAAAPLVNAAVTDALRASLALAQQQAASMFGGSEKLQYTDTAGLSAAKKQALIDANNAADQAEQVRLSNVVRNVPTTTGPFAARNAADLAEQVRLFNQEQARSARIAYAALTPSQQAAASLAANTAAVVAEEVRLANELALRNNPTPVARTSYSPQAGGISSAPPVTPKPVEVLITINGGVYGGPSGIQELASLIRTELLKAKAYTGPLGLA